MSNTNVNFDFDTVLNEVETKKSTNGKRVSLTSVLYNAIADNGNEMSYAKVKLLARAYQFSKTNNLAKFEVFDTGIVLTEFNDIKKVGQSLAQNINDAKKPADKKVAEKMLSQFIEVSQAIETRVLNAIDKALISFEKRDTNVPYNTRDYSLISKKQGDNIVLIER